MKTTNTHQNDGTQTSLIKIRESAQTIRHHHWPTDRIDNAKVLTGLGLTGRQERGYLTLLRIGESKVKVVADPSMANCQEIYRSVEDLQQIDLVQRNATVLLTGAATPMAGVVKILFAQKTNDGAEGDYCLAIVYILALPTVLELLIFPSFSSPNRYLETVFLCNPVSVAISSMEKSFGYSFSRKPKINCSNCWLIRCTDEHCYQTTHIYLVIY